jgi:hypothetical protein
MVTLLRQLGLKREEAIDYANGFVTSDLKNRPGEAVPRRVANDLSNNGILEQQVAKRMNGFLQTALEQIESGK